MQCPACRGKDMFVLEFELMELDYCPDCRGIWLDSGELELIGEKAGALQGDLLSALEADENAKDAVRSDRACPVCNRSLQEVNTAGKALITVDRCPDGHGLWFDHGELGGVIARADTDSDNALVRFFADIETVDDSAEPSTDTHTE